MANDLSALVPKILARAAMSLRKSVVLPRLVNSDWGAEVAKFGSTIDVPIPAAVGTSAVTPAATPPAPTDLTPTTVQVPLDQWRKSDPFGITDKEFREIAARENYIPMQAEEAIKSLAEYINADLMSLFVDFYGFSGTPGTTPFASTTVDARNMRKVLNAQEAPKTDRRLILDDDAYANALGLDPIQKAAYLGSDQAIRQGEIPSVLGFEWFEDHQVPTLTNGTLTDGSGHQALFDGGGDPATLGVKTADFDETSLTGTVKKGQIFTVDGDSQTYVVTADATAAGNAITLLFEPGIQVAWADDAQMTLKGDASEVWVNNLAFNKFAIAFATRPLEPADRQVGGVISSSIVDPKSGIALRLEVRNLYKQTSWEFDILYGRKTVRRELGARLAG